MCRIRKIKYTNYYPGQVIYVACIDHYIAKERGDDEFSMFLYNFKNRGWNKTKIIPKFEEVFEKFIMTKDKNIETVTINPTSERGKINPWLKELVENYFKTRDVQYKQVLERKKTINRQHIGNTGFDGRCENVKNSLAISGEVNGKNIMVVDDIVTTGVSMLEAQKVLLENGAKNVFGFALGLNKIEEDYLEIPEGISFWQEIKLL